MDNTEPVPGRGTQYTLKLSVSAHEFFHAWNVKRIRPRPLGPFDYSQMVRTPSLWISEGLTSYYGRSRSLAPASSLRSNTLTASPGSSRNSRSCLAAPSAA